MPLISPRSVFLLAAGVTVSASATEGDRCIAGVCEHAADVDEAPLMQMKTEAKTLSTDWEGPKKGAKTAWCLSGGGFRALTASMGFARGFAQAGAFAGTGDFDDIGCNSGGCWFMSQFTYSSKFREKILSTKEKIEDVANDFMTTWQREEHPGKLPSWLHRFMHWMLDRDGWKEVASFFDTAVGSIEFASKHNYVWHGGVSNLINTMEKIDDKAATPTNRVDSASKAQLHFQTANMTSFYGTTDGFFGGRGQWHTTTFSSGAHIRRDKVFDNLPMQLIIPSQASNKDIEWFHSEKSKSQAADAVVPDALFGSWKSLKFFDDGGPTISQAAAMASAAIGGFGSRKHTEAMVRSLLDNVPLIFSIPLVGPALRNLLTWLLPMATSWLAEVSFCAGKLDDGNNCKAGTQRLFDGAWVDDLAVAQTVAKLQADHPDDKEFNLVLTNNNAVEDNCALGDLFPNKNITVEYGGAPVKAGAVGGPGYWAGMLKAGMKPSPQFFDKRFGALEWKNALKEVQGRGENDMTPDVLPYGLKYTRFKSKTRENKAYGVKAGTVLNVLLFDLNSPVCLWWARAGGGTEFSSVIPGQYCMGSFTDKKFYYSLAQDVAEGARAVMTEWRKGL